jgi:hypothetical protein
MEMIEMLKKWKCMTCDDVANFKGLCRTCTKYSDSGEVVTPVHRVRLDEFGQVYVPKTREPRRITHEMMVNQRKSGRRLTKRQKTVLQERLKAEAEAMKSAVEVSEDGLMEFGESVVESKPCCANETCSSEVCEDTEEE